MTHERLQQLLAWIDEIHWEGDDRTKVDELVSYIDSSTSAPHRRASLGGRINELENLWADASRRAEKAEARVRELEAERNYFRECEAKLRAERDELRQRILDSCPSPDEGGRIHAGARVVCGQCHDSEVRHLTNERDEARAEVERLRAQVELERMRLAACGVVALANTPEALKQAREMHPDYRSASCEDVARAVEREMKLREERDALRAHWRGSDARE